MATHYVKFTIPQRYVGKADFEFEVKSKKGKGKKPTKRGTLKISKGSIVWKSTRTRKSYKVTWEGFADYAEGGGGRKVNY